MIVAAAGNSNTTQPSYPAAFPGVLSVGASDSAGNLMSFSQYGPGGDVAAPSCVPVAGATGTTYLLTSADIGSRLRFVDSASNTAGVVTQTAPASEIVASAFAPAPAPAVPPAAVPGVPVAPGAGSGTSTPTT